MIIKNILISLVTILHVYFMVLEMFLWTKPLGLKTFKMTPEQALDRAILAGNQGLYNGFLAAGLIWSLIHPNIDFKYQISLFFLSCVTVAAIYGGMTFSMRILMIQGIPALLAICAVVFTKK